MKEALELIVNYWWVVLVILGLIALSIVTPFLKVIWFILKMIVRVMWYIIASPYYLIRWIVKRART